MKYTIYLVKSPSNKCYVGVTSRKFELRKNQHKSDSTSNSKSTLKIHYAIRKYGDQLEWSIIAFFNDKELAFDYESYLIEKLDSYKHGYNMTEGGEGRRVDSKYSEEYILNIAKRYKTKSAWERSIDSAARQFAHSRPELYKKCTEHMENGYLDYTQEQLLENAKKYSSIKEWRKNDKNILQVAHRQGKEFYNKCIQHMKTERYHWKDEELIAIAKQYNTITEWKNNNYAAYGTAKRRPKIYKLCTIHMKRKKKEFKKEK